jgi:hypothetical protein
VDFIGMFISFVMCAAIRKVLLFAKSFKGTIFPHDPKVLSETQRWVSILAVLDPSRFIAWTCVSSEKNKTEGSSIKSMN